MGRPNALPFSCRERAGESLSKTNDLAREAVGCNGMLAGDLGSWISVNNPSDCRCASVDRMLSR